MMKRSKIISFFVLMVIALNSIAQSNIVSGFVAYEVNGQVFLSWTVNGGYTCDGIQILRSTDGFNFDKIGDIYGICGSPNQSIDYEFNDEEPVVNETNFYQLKLGSFEESEVISIEIIHLEDYQMRPNPVVYYGQLYFENDDFLQHLLVVYTPLGVPVYEITTFADYFDVYTNGFLPGQYYFKIYNLDTGEFALSGSFSVFR